MSRIAISEEKILLSSNPIQSPEQGQENTVTIEIKPPGQCKEKLISLSDQREEDFIDPVSKHEYESGEAGDHFQPKVTQPIFKNGVEVAEYMNQYKMQDVEKQGEIKAGIKKDDKDGMDYKFWGSIQSTLFFLIPAVVLRVLLNALH